MTNREQELIKRNMHAFLEHFEAPFILKCGKEFYVYRNKEEYDSGAGSWIQYCNNISYLDGWLYGAVQAKCGQIRKKEIND
jgi:hypothetical protein